MVSTVFLQQTENVGCVVGARSVGCVARHNARTPANFPCPALDLQLTGDHFVGKPSAVGQPTRPTQPFILSGSINKQ